MPLVIESTFKVGEKNMIFTLRNIDRSSWIHIFGLIVMVKPVFWHAGRLTIDSVLKIDYVQFSVNFACEMNKQRQ